MKNFISILFLSVLIFTSCGEENLPEEPEEIVEDNYQPPYTVRYEITFSTTDVNEAFVRYARESTSGTWCIASSLCRGSDILYSNDFLNGWSKEFTVTVNNNPLYLECVIKAKVNNDTTITVKFYVNNELVKESTLNYTPESNSDVWYNTAYWLY